MATAYIYFGAMVLVVVPLIFVHYLCIRVTGLHPDIMPDARQRERYRLSELAMGIAHMLMLWYMFAILNYMVTFCATEPVSGFLAHVPWIVATGAVLVAKTWHLYRLIEQVKAL